MADKEQATLTAQEMLDAVNKAIIAIAVGGQSYKIGSRSLTRADLKQLYSMKNCLQIKHPVFLIQELAIRR